MLHELRVVDTECPESESDAVVLDMRDQVLDIGAVRGWAESQILMAVVGHREPTPLLVLVTCDEFRPSGIEPFGTQLSN
jgi:hypothetical protein